MDLKFYATALVSLLIVNFCSSAATLFPIEDTLVFHHLTTQNGLSDNTVLAVNQDTQGFMWMGTPSGLNRYDGREVRQYRNEEGNATSLSSSYVLSLLPDSSGSMWVGTSEGLNHYNPIKNSIRRIALNGVTQKPTINNRINALFKDSQGRIWIGTPHGLFCKNLGKGMRFSRYLFGSKQPYFIRSLYEDHLQNLWIGTRNGLIKLSWKGEKKEAEYVIFKKNEPDSNVTAITEDAHKRLWVGSDNGKLSHFNNESNRFISVPCPTWSISDLMTDRRGNLWIAGPNQLSVMDPLSGNTTMLRHNPDNPLTLGSEHTLSLFEDRSGSIWVGNYRGGINILHLADTPFQTKKNCFPTAGVTNTITGDKRTELLIGTEAGLCLSNLASGLNMQYSNAITGVKSAIMAADGSTWAGSSNSGLWQFSEGKAVRRFENVPKDTTSLSSDYVTCLLEDRKQRLWIGTSDGLNLLDKATGNFTLFRKNVPPAMIGYIFALLEDSQNNLWIGTNQGIALLRTGAKAFEWFSTIPENSIANGSNGVACIYEDHNRQVWIGTYHYGLMRYDPLKNQLSSYKAPGLPKDVINLMEDNNGNLWLTSYNLLYRLKPASKKIRSYNFHDRIPGYEISERTSYKNKTGDLFFGTNRGLLQFSPDQVKDNTIPPPVLFTSIHILGGKSKNKEHGEVILPDALENPKTLTLSHWEDSFTIGFSVLNYVKPSKNRFAYKLNEFDRDWNYTESPFATYHRLPPGEYTLLAKGANNDGLWSTTPAVLRIHVLPPWWKTWWAYSIYTIVCATLLSMIARFFWLRFLLRKEKEIHMEKLDFFTNISHEMRSHLMLISAPIEKMIRSEKMTRTAHRQLTNIHNNSTRLLVLMKELLDFRKTESGNMQLHITENELIPFLKTTFFAFSELAESRGIQSEFLSESQQIELWFDPEQFQKTVYNLLSNAYKFAPDNGYVEMRVEEQKQTVRIHITDNGKGISADNLEKLFVSYFQVYEPGLVNTGHGLGLALSKSIVELHGGNLQVKSKEKKQYTGGSTTFSITMQKGNAHFDPDQIIQKEKSTALFDEIELADGPSEEFSDEKQEKPTLLLAENHEEFRRLIGETLSENYRVVTCSNGKEAYKNATTLVPDLIISDIMMPEMDGLELCKRIKAHQVTSHIPIILLTAYDPQTYQLKSLRHGADAYISKPFRLEILELKIKNLLAARVAIQQKFSSQILLEPGNVVSVNNQEELFINNLIEFVQENMDHPQFSVNMLCKHMGMSEPVLYKKVRALLNMTVNDFTKTIRLKKAAKLLKAGLSPAEVSASVGYADQKYFSREFKKVYGVAPGRWTNTI